MMRMAKRPLPTYMMVLLVVIETTLSLFQNETFT